MPINGFVIPDGPTLFSTMNRVEYIEAGYKNMFTDIHFAVRFSKLINSGDAVEEKTITSINK